MWFLFPASKRRSARNGYVTRKSSVPINRMGRTSRSQCVILTYEPKQTNIWILGGTGRGIIAKRAYKNLGPKGSMAFSLWRRRYWELWDGFIVTPCHPPETSCEIIIPNRIKHEKKHVNYIYEYLYILYYDILYHIILNKYIYIYILAPFQSQT